MYVRKLKRKCSVRGCKCTDTYAISLTREVGNTVIICKSCLGKALGAIDEIDPKTKSNIPAIDNTAAPSLFFNAKALGTGATETNTDGDPPETPEGTQGENGNADADGKEPDNGSSAPPADDVPDADGTTPPEDATEFKCPVCGKPFDSEKGLKTHLRYCKSHTDNE